MKNGLLAAMFCLLMVLVVWKSSLREEPEQVTVPENYARAWIEENDMGEETAVIYFGTGADQELRTENITVRKLSPECLLEALAVKNIVPLGVRVHSFSLSEDEKTLYLDLSAGFGEYLKTMGESSEKILLAALTNTFLDNYNAKQLVLTVNGKTPVIRSGDCSGPLERKNMTEK